MKRIILPIICLFLLVSACKEKQQETNVSTVTTEVINNEPAIKESVPIEETDAITSATAKPNHASYNGLFVLSPQHYATVTLTIGGIIHSTGLLPGQYIKKGSAIATLENPEFIALQQNYLDASAQLEYLEEEYHRQQRLSQQEAASQKRFQQSKAEYLSMKSRLEAASAQLTLLGVNPVDLQQKGIQTYLEVKSPISGYVSTLDMNLGKYMEAGKPLCEVIDKGEMLLCLTAYEKDIEAFAIGGLIEFRVNETADKTYEATIISIGQSVDKVSRSLEVYAKVKETSNLFRPGMYVSANIKKK